MSYGFVPGCVSAVREHEGQFTNTYMWVPSGLRAAVKIRFAAKQVWQNFSSPLGSGLTLPSMLATLRLPRAAAVRTFDGLLLAAVGRGIDDCLDHLS